MRGDIKMTDINLGAGCEYSNIFFEKLKQIKDHGKQRLFIIADFDHSLTTPDSDTCWGIIEQSGILPEEYVRQHQQAFEHYLQIERDSSQMSWEQKNDLMSQWFLRMIDLLMEFEFHQEMISQIFEVKKIHFRPEVLSFLKLTKTMNIPLIIVSAGLSDMITYCLSLEQCLFDNIMIIANCFDFNDQQLLTGFKQKNLIHTFNKDRQVINLEILQKIQSRHNLVLIGDLIPDSKMSESFVHQIAIKVGFYNNPDTLQVEDYLKHFDLVIKDDASFTEIIKLLGWLTI